MEDINPALETYQKGMAAHEKLSAEYDQKTTMLHKAYEAAVEELGYSHNDLASKRKSQDVARLMFSNKYLGNEEFNPLLKSNAAYKDFADKDTVEQTQMYEQLFGVTAQALTDKGGLLDRFGGGIQRGVFTNAIDRSNSSKLSQQMSSFIWNSVYDPGKKMADNIKAYNDVLVNDPILSQGRGNIDLKDQDLETMTDMLTTSLAGDSTRSSFTNQYGANVKI